MSDFGFDHEWHLGELLDGAALARLGSALSELLAGDLAILDYDETLRRQVVTYLNGFQDMLDDAAARDPQGFAVGQLLASDAGRTYLLFDAAAGDLV